MKIEWRKAEKEIYLPKTAPIIVDIPKFQFITVAGQGNPNKEVYAGNVEKIYSVAYTLKMMPKSGFVPQGYVDYAVYPLEGLWGLIEGTEVVNGIVDKDALEYTIMIRQPDFVTEEVFKLALETAQKKKQNIDFSEVKFEEYTDGLSVQMLHLGSFDEENKSFAQMKEYIDENQLKLKTMVHREIYISDFRRTKKENLKTVLRYMVEKS